MNTQSLHNVRSLRLGLVSGQLQRRSYQSSTSRQQTVVGSGWLPKVVVGNFSELSIVSVTDLYSNISSGRLFKLFRSDNIFLRLRSVLHHCCKNWTPTQYTTSMIIKLFRTSIMYSLKNSISYLILKHYHSHI